MLARFAEKIGSLLIAIIGGWPSLQCGYPSELRLLGWGFSFGDHKRVTSIGIRSRVVPSLKRLSTEMDRLPALKGWAMICRPASRDWLFALERDHCVGAGGGVLAGRVSLGGGGVEM